MWASRLGVTISGQEFFTLDEFCELAGITPPTANKWNKQGKGPVRIRVGRKIYYRALEVREWIESNAARREPDWARIVDIPQVRGGVTADYVTRKELCEIMGLSYSTISQWATYGKGPPYFNIGHKVFYKRSDVKEWLESKREAVKWTHAD